MKSELSWAMRFVNSGKTFSDKTKIITFFALSLLRNRSPIRIRSYFDLLVRGTVVETDVKFKIGTLFDFFIMSAVWEPELKEAFQFKEGMIFLDIGAHIGRYTIRAGKKVGQDGKVLAIEPNPTNYGFLCQNIYLNELGNCIAFNLAAYDRDMELTLFRGDDSAKNSLKEDSGKGFYKVKARALDNVLREAGVENVDLIKIDVEGAEYETLKGLERTLTSGNPKLILEILRRDERKVKDYLFSLDFLAKLLHYSADYEEGIMYYLFEKKRLS